MKNKAVKYILYMNAPDILSGKMLFNHRGKLLFSSYLICGRSINITNFKLILHVPGNQS